MVSFLGEYVFGAIWVKMSGGLYERLLNDAASSGILLKNIKMYDDGFVAKIPKRFYKAFEILAKKHRCSATIIKRRGMFLRTEKIKGRCGIVFGAAAALLLMIYSQNLIWNIKFYDFTKEEETKMRALMYQFGICEGIVAKTQTLNEAEDNIVINSEDYGWVSLNFFAGRLVVEKTDRKPHSTITDKELTNMVATCDGIVREIDVSGGFLQVCEGQSVAKGDVLVSGTRQDVSGRFLYTHADAKIFAETQNTYEVSVPLKINIALPGSEEKRFYSFCVLDKTFDAFRDKKYSGDYIERVNKYPLNIMGFSLPCTVIKYSIRPKQKEFFDISTDTAVSIARVRILEQLKKDLPDAKVVTMTESFEQQGDNVVVRQKIISRANIAKTQKL